MVEQQTETVHIQGTDEMEIDLVELLYFFRSRLIVIIIGFVVGALVAGSITQFFITPKFTGVSKVYMVSSSSDSVVDLTDLNIGTSLSSDYEELLKTRPIIEGVIEELDLDHTYEELLDMITIATINDTRILTITAESTIPEEAQAIANTLADMAVSELPGLMDTATPNIAEWAVFPEKKSSPSLATNTMIGALICMAVVLGVLTFFYVTDDTLKTADDVEKEFGVMPLTLVPDGYIEAISDKVEEYAGTSVCSRRGAEPFACQYHFSGDGCPQDHGHQHNTG